MAIAELYRKLSELKIDETIEALKKVNTNLKFGDTFTAGGITAAAFAFAPYYSLAAALVVHASSKDVRDEIDALNADLRKHFKTLVDAIPSEWTIKEFTDSNRVQDMLGYLIALNPSAVILEPFSKFKTDEMNQDFIKKICNPAGIVALNGKLVLTAARGDNETAWQYFARIQGRLKTEVSQNLYGKNSNGDPTLVNKALDATSTVAKVPFQVGEMAIGGLFGVTTYLYNGVTSAFGKTKPSANSSNHSAHYEFGNMEDDDNDAKELKESDLVAVTNDVKTNELVNSRQNSMSPTKRK